MRTPTSVRTFLVMGVISSVFVALTESRAGAQNTNVAVQLHFRGAAHPYSFVASPQTNFVYGCYPTQESGIFQDSVSTQTMAVYRDSMQIPLVSTAGTNGNQSQVQITISLTVDAAAHVLRNVVMQFGIAIGQQNSYSGLLSRSYSASFDSIPFTKLGNDIVVQPMELAAKYSWQNSFSSIDGVACQLSGGQSEQGIERDSISMSIGPARSSVGTNEISLLPLGLSVSYENSDVVFNTHASENNSMLKVADLTGRTVASLPIDGGSHEVRLHLASLSTGIYFARVGTQVTKFVVPPNR